MDRVRQKWEAVHVVRLSGKDKTSPNNKKKKEKKKMIMETEKEPFDLAPFECQNDTRNLARDSKKSEDLKHKLTLFLS